MSKYNVSEIMRRAQAIQAEKNRKESAWKRFTDEEMADRALRWFKGTGKAPTLENMKLFSNTLFKEDMPDDATALNWLNIMKKRNKEKGIEREREKKHRRFRKRIFKREVIEV